MEVEGTRRKVGSTGKTETGRTSFHGGGLHKVILMRFVVASAFTVMSKILFALKVLFSVSSP